MIVVVEGPSAAGKTTWCRRHAERFVPEHIPTGDEPDGSDVGAQADHWTLVNTGRWAQAVELERQGGLAVCDSDPSKLHCSWCLAAVGAAPRQRFTAEAERCRAAFARGHLGMADVVLVADLTTEQLCARRAGDRTRRRRSFDLHVRLREPLMTWYAALDRLDPGRVVWDLPVDGRVPDAVVPRPDRCDPALLDALLASLPTV